MKTLLFHISSLLDGKIEKVLIELLQGLDPEKYKVRLCIAHSLDELEVLKSEIAAHVELHYILDSRLSATKKKKINNTISHAERIYEELVLPVFKKNRHRTKLKELIKDTDVIVDFDMTLTPYTFLLRDKKKVAYCHSSLGNYWDGNKRKLDKLAGRLKRYDKVVMLCDEMKDKAGELYPALQGNVLRIYNALDNKKIHQLSGESLGIYDYLLEDGYFVSVGRLDEHQKDTTMLIKGFAACVKKYGIKQHLAIVGDGPSQMAMEELAIEEGVGELVAFPGYQTNPYKWMHNSELFLFCSKYEGWPTVLIEALSLSCPIVATDTPTGVEEILMQGKCGKLVKPGAADELCEAIYTLLNDKDCHKVYRDHSQDLLRHFEINNMVREFERQIIEA